VGADQVAELEPSVQEVFEMDAAGRQWCATFTLEDDADRWVQVTRSELNFAYPYDGEPSAFLEKVELPAWAALSLIDWAAQSFATFSFPGGLTARQTSELADLLFTAVVGAEEDYALDIEVFEIPPPSRK
jgi:hypothetical protein